MSFSDEIMIIRQKSFLTHTEFAAKINVAYNTVNRWETGKSRPNMTAMKNIKAFCSEQGIDYSSLEKAWIQSKVTERSEKNG